MIALRTVVDFRGITRLGVLEIRLAVETFDDVTGRVLGTHNHRTVVAPGDNLDTTIEANNRSLVDMGFPVIAGSELAILRADVAREHTPAVIAAYRARRL